jgi:ABC-type multidrug transport system fused ATPase/permease subunit
MNNLRKIFFIFSKKQKLHFKFLSFFMFFCIFLEMLSLAIIVPVFNVIFNEQSSWINLYINNDQLLKSNFFKITILTILIFTYFLKNIFLIIYNYFSIKFYSSLQLEVSNKLFLQYLNNNYNIVNKKNSDYLVRKILNDTDGVRLYCSFYNNLIVEFIFTFFLFSLLLFYNYKITLFIAFFFLLIIACYVKFIKTKINRWAIDYQSSYGQIQNIIMEGVRGIRDIIIYKLEKQFFLNFNELNKGKVFTLFKLDLVNTIQRFWMEIFAIFVVVTPLIIYIYFDKPVNELIPIFALFVACLFRMLPTSNRIINYFNSIKFYQPSLDAVHDQFQDFNSEENLNEISNIFDLKKSFSFNNVSFFYNTNSFKILNQANLLLLKGECTIILGENGSGKSTFLNILSSLIKPSSGQVLVDEKINIHENKLCWLKKISYVQQDVFLLNKTITENITLNFDNKYDFDNFNKIKELLFLDEAFQNLPNKLDSVVGTNGINLSGGQRQIISIARALYKNGELFLFDEPSSALDYDYQNILKKIISILKQNNKTIIIVTHDLNLFRDFADSIYKIESGNIVKQF